MTTTIGLDDNYKLQLHIYVTGYYPMGESILVIVYERDRKKVHKSILIDCFEQNETNHLHRILDSYGINGGENSLDFVIWTHPDKDHSIGFDSIVKKYSAKKTLFILPEGLTRDLVCSDSAKDSFEIISNQSSGICYNVERVNVSNQRQHPLVYGKTIFTDLYTDPISFEIEILTPFSGKVFRKMECCEGFCPNDISISLLVKFGQLNFYFGGDSENYNISMIEELKLQNLDFIKIPHHASSSSDQLIRKINKGFKIERLATSVSTSFAHGKSRLPEMAVLRQYNKYSDRIFLTENNHHENNYGIWKFVYNILEQQLYLPESFGDATQWSCPSSN